MPKYNVENILADSKYSEFIYARGNKEVTVKPSGRGAPKQKIEVKGKEFTLKLIRKYAPAPAVKAAKAPKEKAPKLEVRRVEVKGDVKRTELVYKDGSVVIPTGGRPRLTNAKGSPLVEIRTVVPGKVKGKKGRAKLPVEITEVTEGEGIFYVYGGKEVPRASVVPGRGAPPKTYKGATLEKVIKRVLSEAAIEAAAPAQEEEVQPTMAEKGWKVGQRVHLKGSEKIAEVVVVRDYHIGIQYPGSKFIDTHAVSKLVRL